MNKILLIIIVSALLGNLAYSQEYYHDQPYPLQGVASWYSEEDPGILETTANMEIFDDDQLTCAMWNMPFNALLEVTNLNNGKSVVVRVNDRGPAKRLVAEGRIIDLTKEAFSRIAILREGLVSVEVVIVYLP